MNGGHATAPAQPEEAATLNKIQKRLRKRMTRTSNADATATTTATGGPSVPSVDARLQQWLEIQAHSRKMTVEGVCGSKSCRRS